MAVTWTMRYLIHLDPRHSARAALQKWIATAPQVAQHHPMPRHSVHLVLFQSLHLWLFAKVHCHQAGSSTINLALACMSSRGLDRFGEFHMFHVDKITGLLLTCYYRHVVKEERGRYCLLLTFNKLTTSDLASSWI